MYLVDIISQQYLSLVIRARYFWPEYIISICLDLVLSSLISFAPDLSCFDWFWCMEQMQKRLITVILYQTTRYYIHKQEFVYISARLGSSAERWSINLYDDIIADALERELQLAHLKFLRVQLHQTFPWWQKISSPLNYAGILDRKLDSTRYIWACRSDRFAYFESLFMLSQEEPTFGQDRCNS